MMVFVLNGLIMFILVLTSFWVVLNVLYILLREKFVSKGFKLYYGLLLVYKKEGSSFKSIPVFGKLSYLLIALFAATLMYFYLTLVLNIISRLSGIGGFIKLLVPGVHVRGINLVYFIVSLIIAAIVHELSHAFTARTHNVKIKSIGFAVLPVLALAFVEVDDESFSKLSRKSKSSILSAGPVSNLLLGLLALIISSILIDPYGLVIVETVKGGFAEEIGIKPYDTILAINNQPINISILRSYMSTNEEINLTFSILRGGEVLVINAVKPGNISQLGVYMVSKPRDTMVKLMGLKTSLETLSFINWFHIVNVSLAFINALPLFISDGGRIVYEVLRNKKLATVINISTLILLLTSILSSTIPLS